MHFLDMHWSDFKSFTGEHYLDFRRYGPGLYSIRGENRAEPELGSNGAAKSSILDVMHWCLFGTSIRGIKSTQLVPWNKSGNPNGSIKFKLLDETITVTRTYKPTSIILKRNHQETSITQEQLENLINLTSETFQNSIVIGQFSRMFFDLKPREKMSVFSELLNLDYWLECSSQSREILSTLREDEQNLQRKLDRTKVLLKEQQKAITHLREERENSKINTDNKMSDIKKQQRILKVREREIGGLLRNLRRNLKTAEREEKKSIKKMLDLERELDSIRNQISLCDQERASQKTVIKVHREQVTLLKYPGDICPTCGQKMTEDHRRRETKKYTDAIRSVEGKIIGIEEKQTKLNTALAEGKKGLANAKLVLDKSYTHQLELEIKEYERVALEVKMTITWNEETLETLKSQHAEYIKKIKKQKLRLIKIKKKYKDHQYDLKKLTGIIEQTQFWVKGFKDIRLFEIEEAITALEVEVNSYLVDLGMEGWSVKLDVERETKSGTISRGFQVIVTPNAAKDSEPKPWEAWSGGEGQRLRIAGTLAMSNLILRQFNSTSNLQIWDEQMTFLSGTGEDDVLNLLRESAIREYKQIWIINQHNLEFGFDGVLDVVKDHRGSRLEE